MATDYEAYKKYVRYCRIEKYIYKRANCSLNVMVSVKGKGYIIYNGSDLDEARRVKDDYIKNGLPSQFRNKNAIKDTPSKLRKESAEGEDHGNWQTLFSISSGWVGSRKNSEAELQK